MQQVGQLDKERTPQVHPVKVVLGPPDLFSFTPVIFFPGFQLGFPTVSLTLKALPSAVSPLCRSIFGTGAFVVPLKDFLVPDSHRQQSDVARERQA